MAYRQRYPAISAIATSTRQEKANAAPVAPGTTFKTMSEPPIHNNASVPWWITPCQISMSVLTRTHLKDKNGAVQFDPRTVQVAPFGVFWLKKLRKARFLGCNLIQKGSKMGSCLDHVALALNPLGINRHRLFATPEFWGVAPDSPYALSKREKYSFQKR